MCFFHSLVRRQKFQEMSGASERGLDNVLGDQLGSNWATNGLHDFEPVSSPL